MSELLITLLKNALPYLVAGAAGFGLAFGIQELRLTSLEQEFQQYKLDQQKEAQDRENRADVQRKETDDAYKAKQKELAAAIQAGEVYKRCVVAGKCGVRNAATVCAQSAIPAPGSADAARSDAIPASGGDAALNECAQTTLMLNQLQSAIEKQEGYEQK